MKQTALYIYFFFAFSILNAQVSIQVTTDKFEYEIGDYIRVEITAVADSTIAYYWPAANEIAPYEIISVNPVDTINGNGEIKYQQKIIYSIYEPDKYYFPQVTIPYKRPNDNTAYFATSDSIPFIVNGIAVDTTASIKSIKLIQEVVIIDLTPLYIFLIINLIIAVAFIIYFFFIRKEKVAEKVTSIKEQKSLHILTLEQLELLSAKKLWQQDELKLYYSELTDILRNYLEKRFNINALESTSDEILAQIEHLPEASSAASDIAFILQLADMAKFAKSRPLAHENVKAMDLAVQFVELTKPQEPSVIPTS